MRERSVPIQQSTECNERNYVPSLKGQARIAEGKVRIRQAEVREVLNLLLDQVSEHDRMLLVLKEVALPGF